MHVFVFLSLPSGNTFVKRLSRISRQGQQLYKITKQLKKIQNFNFFHKFVVLPYYRVNNCTKLLDSSKKNENFNFFHEFVVLSYYRINKTGQNYQIIRKSVFVGFHLFLLISYVIVDMVFPTDILKLNDSMKSSSYISK